MRECNTIMALDQQRNWTISMAESLQATKDKTAAAAKPHEQSTASFPIRDDDPKPHGYHSTEPAYLPDELVLEILSYVSHTPEAQKSLHTCCLLSRQWYTAALPYLYAYPKIYGKNYDPFVRTLCPSINLRVKDSPLASLVKVLNLGLLVHHSSKSVTARVLRRTEASLEEFVAPQASFAINSFAALSKSHNLRSLDLSLVSEAQPLDKLFSSLRSLKHLERLRFPRSSGFGAKTVDPDSIIWPPALKDLYLSGGIDANFLYGIVHFPPSLERLTIEHCPQAKSHAIRALLTTLSRARLPLKSLSLSHLPRLGISSLDPVLGLFPDLEELSVSVDYITPAIFNPDFQEWQSEDTPNFTNHKLRTLAFTNSGNPGVDDKFSPIDVLLTLDEGSFPNLRKVRIARSLGWERGETRDETEALIDRLVELGTKDYEEKTGVFADMSTHQWRNANWKDWAGVWIID
ncbi:hypothetical protein D6C86_01158 [Aureobasidium pullulans]|nr:hypothetical protein D6C86_01158 [Aureobasidium pullulans]THZ95969.1 hypothetical protein D6C88_01750 [Aureobasidium pullulans]